MDTFQTPPTQQKCLLFYWPLIFLSGTFYVLVLLVATLLPLYNLSTLHMHSSVLGEPVSRTTSTLLPDLLCSDHCICGVMQPVPSSQQQSVCLWLLPCLLYYVTLSPGFWMIEPTQWLSLCMWTMALHCGISQTPPPWSCSHWWPIVVQHRTQTEHLFVFATLVGSLTSMPNHLHTAVIWLLCLPAMAGCRHQVHLDASQVHQGRVQKAVGSVDSLVWPQCHMRTGLIALLLDA